MVVAGTVVVAVDWRVALGALIVSTTEVRSVAKKKAKGSETRRFNTLVRMDDELIERAKVIAAIEGVSLGELFLPVLRPFIEKKWKEHGRKMMGRD
jgi:hypothetical protein